MKLENYNKIDQNLILKRQNYLEQKNFIALGQSLLESKATDRILGAEINSVAHLISENIVDEVDQLHFLVSDTQDGRDTGEVLKYYYKRIYPKEVAVDFHVIEGLDDRNPKLFKNKGLRNLIKKISYFAKNYSTETLLINATGGYKAQILFAGVLGQSLGIPVYYLFETFREIIQLPPQPISLDSDFWVKHQDMFFSLSNNMMELGKDIESSFWYPQHDSKFDILIDAEEIDGKTLLSLSTTGEIFHQTFFYRYQNRYRSEPDLDVAIEKKKPSFGHDHHMPHGIQKYLEALTEEIPFIIQCRTDNLKNKTFPNRFSLRPHNNDLEIIGCYSSEFSCEFIVFTTAKTIEQKEKAVLLLNNHVK